MDFLPREILLEIFSRCTKASLYHAQFVCKYWFDICLRSITALAFYANNNYDGPYSALAFGTNAKDYSKDRLSNLWSRINCVNIHSLYLDNQYFSAAIYVPVFSQLVSLNVVYTNLSNVYDHLKCLRHLTLLTQTESEVPWNVLSRLERLSFTLSSNPYLELDGMMMALQPSFYENVAKCTSLRTLDLAPLPSGTEVPFSLSQLTNLEDVTLTATGSNNQTTLASCKACRCLRTLRLRGLFLADLPVIAPLLPQLDSIFINNVSFDAKLFLPNPPNKSGFFDSATGLSSLFLSVPSIRDLHFLFPLSHSLRSLVLRCVTVGPGMSSDPLRALSRLTSLDMVLQFEQLVSQSWLSPVLMGLPRLTSLSLRVVPLSPNISRTLQQLTGLRHLYLEVIPLTVDFLRPISSLVNLRSIGLVYLTYSLNRGELKTLVEPLTKLALLELRHQGKDESKGVIPMADLADAVNALHDLDELRLSPKTLEKGISLSSFPRLFPYVSVVGLTSYERNTEWD